VERTQAKRTRLLAMALALVGILLVGGCGAGVEETVVPAVDVAKEPAAPPTDESEPSAILLVENRALDPGECTTLEWRTDQMIKAYVDGRGVDLSGTMEVCPTSAVTYTLLAVRADGTEIERSVVVTVSVPTLEPSETPAPTATSAPATAAPPTATATATVTPTAEVHVEFYPDNGVLELPRDQSCTAVNWKTTGVTDVQLEREGLGRKPVGSQGREEACFSGRQMYYLYYKLPDGTEQRAEMELRHSN